MCQVQMPFHLEWLARKRKQLDQIDCQGVHGGLVQKMPGATVLLCPHWQYFIKQDGKRRSHNCCYGSGCTTPILLSLLSRYPLCVEQPIDRLFFLVSACMPWCLWKLAQKLIGLKCSQFFMPLKVTLSWVSCRKVTSSLSSSPPSISILCSPKLNFKNSTHVCTIYSRKVSLFLPLMKAISKPNPFRFLLAPSLLFTKKKDQLSTLRKMLTFKQGFPKSSLHVCICILPSRHLLPCYYA